VELLADPTVCDVRRCDAPTCVILFLARHPNRRWCTPTICGNRARVARYYQRHKPVPADGTGH
jgi:predicted RNA-binding Zn ribbon-like protein